MTYHNINISFTRCTYENMLYEKLPLMSGHFANVKARLIFQLPFFVFMQHRMHPRAKRELKIKKNTLRAKPAPNYSLLTIKLKFVMATFTNIKNKKVEKYLPLFCIYQVNKHSTSFSGTEVLIIWFTDIIYKMI